MPFPFPCSPVVHEWLWKKIQIEKKSIFICSTHFCWTPLTKCVFIFLNFYICRSIHFFSIFRFFSFFFVHWKDITFEFLKMPCCLYLYTLYRCEYFLWKLLGDSPHFRKNGIFGGGSPPTQKVEGYPWQWKHQWCFHYSIAVQRVLFDFGLKKLFNKRLAFPPS